MTSERLTKPGDGGAAGRVPDKEAVLDSHARGTVLATEDLGDGVGVLLVRLGDHEALRVLIAKAKGRVGDGAGNGIRLRGVKGSVVSAAVRVLGEEVAEGVVETLSALGLGVGDELLRLGGLGGGVLTRKDSSAADGAEHESGGGGGELHCCWG